MKHDWLINAWYQKKLTWLTGVLLPFSWLFGAVVWLRRKLYQAHWLRSYKLPVPVIIVGNITVGGTGKTPTVIALADFLTAQGYHVGIISRGYGGLSQRSPLLVTSTSSPRIAGDEAVLMAKRMSCPVVVCTDRVAAAHYLLASTQCNLIISDDGLQHYRLQRDIEIVVTDVKRQYGNRHLLPAGPLREPCSRLTSVDFVLNDIMLQPLAWHLVKNPAITRPLSDFASQSVHAVAGIGNPQRFFESLKAMNIIINAHAYNDHHCYTALDLHFEPALPVLMTEKDAVKCTPIANDETWYLAVKATLPDTFLHSLLTLLKG